MKKKPCQIVDVQKISRKLEKKKTLVSSTIILCLPLKTSETKKWKKKLFLANAIILFKEISEENFCKNKKKKKKKCVVSISSIKFVDKQKWTNNFLARKKN